MNSLTPNILAPVPRAWRNWLSISLLLAAGLATAQSRPGVIRVSVNDTRGHIRVGERFEVVVQVDGYTDPARIDGFNVRVAYDASLFALVDGSFNPGSNAGVDRQWLTKVTPPIAVSLALFVEGSEPGLLTVSVANLALVGSPAGTMAGSGFLFSFQLEAIAVGNGEITPGPFPDGSVLFDPTLTPAGIPQFVGETKLKTKKAK